MYSGLYDTDDEVRDRATFYYHLLKEQQKPIINTYVLNRLPVSVVGLENALLHYTQDESQHDTPFDLKSVPLETSGEVSRMGMYSSLCLLRKDSQPVLFCFVHCFFCVLCPGRKFVGTFGPVPALLHAGRTGDFNYNACYHL